ncbi:pre-mRNA-processing factor 39 [Hyalella azteca]|uniref:Pre-mRNA-processing factor 39 n=1 Tax=Hyalella azteca TaxID=294128 RepID=A0A8B7NSN9_HYAAZ|nr:pre-mRNA-processing factor 39 [Hyalella azteca]
MMAESPGSNTEDMQFGSEGDANSVDSFEKQLQQQELELQSQLREQELELEAKKAAAVAAFTAEAMQESEEANSEDVPKPVMAPTGVPEPVAAPQNWPDINTNGSMQESDVAEVSMEEATSGGEEQADTQNSRSADESEGTAVVVGVKRSSPCTEETNEEDKSNAEADEEEKQRAAKQRKIDEFTKLWNAATENPKDFQAWTNLLQHVDQQSDLECGRQSYTAFFARYPYCYGYWKKYADLEKRKGTKETTMQVFEDGLAAIPLSVDLWVHYLDYVTHNYNEPQDEHFVRLQFDRAVEACGMEFRSDKMWDAFINWESSNKRWLRVTCVYDRLLAMPVSKYLTHWTKFQDHIRKHPANEVIPAEEYHTHKRSLRVPSETNADGEDATAAAAPEDDGIEAPPGVEDDGLASADADETTISNEPPANEEENKSIQQLIIKAREVLHEKSTAEVKKRWSYEDAIKRPYFHVKPLERSQLQAWRDYLHFEIKQGNEKRIKTLFERCLIAAALYEEFWMRYLHYLEGQETTTPEELRSVYERACNIHLKDKLKPHLSWATFEEESGNVNRALELLSDLQANLPDALEPHLQAVAVERRRGDLEKADMLFNFSLDIFRSKEKGLSLSYANLLVKYARFLTLFRENSAKGTELLKAELEEHIKGETKPAENDHQSLEMIVWALVEQAMACTPPNFLVAAEALKTGFSSIFQPRTRVAFAHRYLQFVSECGHPGVSLSQASKIVRELKLELRQQGMTAEENAEDSQMEKPDQSDHSSSSDHRRDKRNKSYSQSSDKHYSQGGHSGGHQHNGNVGGGGFNQGLGGGINNYTQYPPPNAVGGIGAPPPHQPPPQHPPPQSQPGGYGGGYNQNYQQSGYPPQQQYQGWGYPPQQQQQGYGYNQQGWGGYPNYYGQR